MPNRPVNRKLIKDTLLSRLQTATFTSPINGFNTWVSGSRRLKMWGNVDKSVQPALFLVQHRESRQARGTGNLMRRYLDLGAWCYAPSGDESIIGDDLIDLMESGIESVMGPDDPTTNELTLGGLVSWVRIVREDGVLIRDPGDIDGQAVLILPIRILLP